MITRIFNLWHSDIEEFKWQLKAEVRIICRLNFSCQAALEDARKEWTNDMSQNFATGMVCPHKRCKCLNTIDPKQSPKEF